MRKQILPFFTGFMIFWIIILFGVVLSTNAGDGILSKSIPAIILLLIIISLWFGLKAIKLESKKVFFGWLTYNLSLVFIILIALSANVFFYLQEQELEKWKEETPDYESVIPNPAEEMIHPGEGGLLPPNVSLELKSDREGETITFTIDQWGFRRTDNIDIEKPENVFRILNLGDSFVAGYRLTDGKVFGSVLEKLCNEDATNGKYHTIERVEVLNTVVLNPTLALEYLQRHGNSFQPDLIIYNTCLANDLLELSLVDDGREDRPEPIFYFDENDQVQGVTTEEMLAGREGYEYWFFSGEYKLDPEVYSEGWLDNPERFKELEPKPVQESFALLRKIAVAMRVAGSNEYKGFSHTPGPERPVFHWTQVQFLLKDLPPPVQGCYEVFERILSLYEIESEKLEVPMIITAIPMRYQVIEEDRRMTFEEGPLNPDYFELLKPQNFLSEKVPEYGLEFFDFTPVFSNAEVAAHELYFAAPDIHWNVAGHELAAKELKKTVDQYILEYGMNQ